jgi:peptide subunit release factor 1 (eRF1)
MLAYLDDLAAAPGENALSVYLPPRLPAAELENALTEVPAVLDIAAQLFSLATRSETGVVIIWSSGKKCLISPPFPVSGRNIAHLLDVAGLRALLTRDFRVGLVLVRLGAYAVGVCAGEKVISSKVGTGLVHGRHRQGGSSAHRFERHRDKQIETFLTRVCQRVREQLEPHLKSLDYVVYGGARQTILLLQKQCPLLQRLEIPVLPPLLDIPDPRQAVLEAAVARLWSSTVMEWEDA